MNKRAVFWLGSGLIFVAAALYFADSLFIKPYYAKLYSGTATAQVLSDDEIKQRAMELGMIPFEQLPKTNSATQTPEKEQLTDEEIISRAARLGMSFVQVVATEQTAEQPATQQPTPQPSAAGKISVTIMAGMPAVQVAEMFQQNGVVSDANDFKLYLIEQAATRELRSGNYNIPVGSSYEQILDIITTRRR